MTQTAGEKSYSKRQKTVNIVVYVILAVMAVIWLLPIVWLVITSFSDQMGPSASFIPKKWTFNNYVRLITDESFPYWRWFLNTLFVAIVSCVISTLFVLMTSYTLSRLRFKWRKKFLNIGLILGMFPGFMSMAAIYAIIEWIGLSQSLFALILVYCAGAAMGFQISKGFFDTISHSLDEAATIDGANKNTIFWRIILPLSKPILVYTALTTFISPWVDYIFVSYIMKDNKDNYTVAFGLQQMLERENNAKYYTTFFAGSVIVALPITLLFIKMQKYYVEGVTGGAVKG